MPSISYFYLHGIGCKTGYGNLCGNGIDGYNHQQSFPQAGDTITATLEPADGNADYQWQRFVSGTWQNIETATGVSYTVESADIGYALRVTATGIEGYSGTVESIPIIVRWTIPGTWPSITT